MYKLIVFVIVNNNKYVSILERNNNGKYKLLANIYQGVTTDTLYQMSLLFKGNQSDVRIVSLGLLENKEFVSEEVDNLFKLEVDNIIAGVNNI